jgi:hypothetical protein
MIAVKPIPIRICFSNVVGTPIRIDTETPANANPSTQRACDMLFDRLVTFSDDILGERIVRDSDGLFGSRLFLDRVRALAAAVTKATGVEFDVSLAQESITKIPAKAPVARWELETFYDNERKRLSRRCLSCPEERP